MSYMSYENHMSIFMNCLKSHVFFIFKKFGIFLLVYKDRKPKL